MLSNTLSSACIHKPIYKIITKVIYKVSTPVNHHIGIGMTTDSLLINQCIPITTSTCFINNLS